MYVITRIPDGAFVARDPGKLGPSYTKYLQRAQTFATKEQAERELCPENEQALHIDKILERRF